jgi:GntR family transcriptional repressor for pyruvate dehydrogenase complex
MFCQSWDGGNHGRDVPVSRPRPKASEVVANWLRRPIVEGEMAEGAAFPTESQLSEQLGVSRPTVREAMRILESEGLVVVRRGMGGGARARRPQAAAVARAAGFVLQERNTTVGDVFACRELLEVRAIALVLQRPDRDEAFDALKAALEAEGAAAGAPDDDTVSEGRFHQVLVEAAGSPTLELYAAITNQVVHTHTRNFLREHSSEPLTSAMGSKAHAAHHRLLALLRTGDLDGAQRQWRNHLRSTEKVLAADRDVPVSLLGEPVDPRTAIF